MQHSPETARISDRQLAFCRAYADGASGAEAARRAGYSSRSARYQARDLLAKPHIREAIECLHVAVDDMSFEGHVRALALLRDQARAGEGEPEGWRSCPAPEGRAVGFRASAGAAKKWGPCGGARALKCTPGGKPRESAGEGACRRPLDTLAPYPVELPQVTPNVGQK